MTKRKRKTIDVRQVLAIGLIALFSVVTVEHVARYLGQFEPPGEQWVGYVYAIGGDFAIAVCALFTRWTKTQRTAWFAYFALVIAECVFNVCYIEPWRKGLGAFVYALYPTFIVAVLSILQRDVDKLTGASTRTSSIISALLRRAGLDVAEDAEEQPQVTPESPQVADNGHESVYKFCESCGFVAYSPQAWAGHCKGAAHQAQEAQL